MLFRWCFATFNGASRCRHEQYRERIYMKNLETQHTIPLKIENITFNSKSDQTIEIVIVPKLEDKNAHQENVGIELDEDLIFEILSKHYQHVQVTQINTQRDLDDLAGRRPDLVFSGVKYFHFNSENLWLNDFLDSHDIAYMASNRAALDGEHDKDRAKRTMQKANINTACFFVTKPDEYLTEDSIPLAFPLFIKPVSSGDSMGIDANSIVTNFLGFQSKILDIYRNQYCSSMVETYLPGKEYSVGIFEDGVSGTLRAMPIEIIAEPNENGHRILDFDIKRNDSEKVLAVTDTRIHKALSDLAKNAFKALGGKSLGRIDIKMNENNVPHFIEANLMPGLRRGYFYRACLLNLDMSYEQMILTIAENGLSSKDSQLDVLTDTTQLQTQNASAVHAIDRGMVSAYPVDSGHEAVYRPILPV